MCGCPCGFVDHSLSGSALHRAHRTAHLAVFPAADQVTVDNLGLFVTWAEEREA